MISAIHTSQVNLKVTS